MNHFLSDISDKDIALAKKRIWNKMESKLPARGLSDYQSVVSSLNASKSAVELSRLAQAQVKERMLDSLPEREVATFSFAFPRRSFAAMTLSAFFVFLFIPVFQGPQLASASSVSSLEVAQGNVFVNGGLVSGNIVLYEGDTVMTEQGAMAHLQMMDDSRLTLGPDTRIILSTIDSDPFDRNKTTIVVDQLQGRLWTQVVNLVDPEASVSVRFPDGEVTLYQRATVDVRVDKDEIELQVVQNLVEVDVSRGENYEGTLGQGARMLLTDTLLLDESRISNQNDVWLSFNSAYGKDYLRRLDEKYTNEAIKRVMILPGNPLYVFKTFRETVREKLTFNSDARGELAALHAQKRLDESQVLRAEGENEIADDLLVEYEEKVALLDEDLKEAQLDEAQKSGAVLTSSQQLRMVPELLESGDLEVAADYLSDYKDESRSLLVELEGLNLEDRGDVVSELLEDKLEDFQMIRVIASLSEDTGESFEEVEAEMMEELSMLVLSLREKSLDNLADFFEETEYDLEIQQNVYTRLIDSVELSPELTEQFEEAEAEIAAGDEGVLIDVTEVEEVVDTRFLDLDISHSDESEDES